MATNTDLWGNDSVGGRTYISGLPTGKPDQDGLSGQYRSGCYGSFDALFPQMPGRSILSKREVRLIRLVCLLTS
ncbi:hypothetical protein AB1F57_04975 [Streptococcus sp. ZY1909104]|uniref:hypothetical protein n=1 Tax=Streptococcus sp. ZY1909104 TaxID=3233335 RepID=UPI0012901EFA